MMFRKKPAVALALMGVRREAIQILGPHWKLNEGASSNGRTADLESADLGSTPSAPSTSRPTAAQLADGGADATGTPPAELLKAENAALRRERDALRDDLREGIRIARSFGADDLDIWADAMERGALASETGGASTKKS